MPMLLPLMCRPSLARSREHLLKLGALKEVSPGKLALTEAGQVLVNMPLEVEMGFSILAADRQQCSEEVAIIGCMAAAGGTRVFRSGKGTPPPSQSPFAAQSGDHETYLNVYEAWLSNNQSQSWCDQHGLFSPVLEAASETLSKVHRVMGQHMLAPQQHPGGKSPHRSTAILQSLCAGYFRQLASAADPNDTKAGFWLVEDYDVNPKAAMLYRPSVLTDKSQVQTVLFGEQMAAGNGQNLLMHVSQVEPQWVVQGAAGGSSAAIAAVQAVRTMQRQEYHVPVTPFPQVIYAYACCLDV